MSTQQSADFVRYMHSHLGIRLGYHLDWTPIAQCIQSLPKMDWYDMDLVKNTILRLETQKRNEPAEIATQHKAHYDLFFGQLLDHMLKDITDQEHYYRVIPELVRAWTTQGTEDVDPMHIKTIGPHYQLALSVAQNKNRRPYTSLLEGLMHLPQIWTYAKHVVMPDLKTILNQEVDIQSIQWRLLHRFEPHLVTLDDYEQISAYSDICGRLENMELAPQQLVNILKGPHHNTAAWFVAMNAYMIHTPLQEIPNLTNVNDPWSVLIQQIRTLSLDPSKRMDWMFWDNLYTLERHYPLLAPVLETVQKVQPHMHEAFTTFWPLVTGMFDAQEDLYAKAAHYYGMQNARVENVSLHLDFEQA